jgi:hypothetical protein
MYTARSCLLHPKSIISGSIVMRVYCTSNIFSPICYGSQRFIAICPLLQLTLGRSRPGQVPYNPVSYHFPTCARVSYKAALYKVFQTTFYIFLLLLSILMCCLLQPPNMRRLTAYNYKFVNANYCGSLPCI